MSRRCLAWLIVCLLTSSGGLRADVAKAKLALADGLKAFDAQDWQGVSRNLARADAELKAVAQAQKAEAQAEVDHLRHLYALARDVEGAEKSVPEALKQLKSTSVTPEQRDKLAARTLEHLDQLRRRLALLPADDTRAKAYKPRIDTLNQQFAKQSAGTLAKLVAAKLQQEWNRRQAEAEGWELEVEGPNWEEYARIRSADMSKFLAPKTFALFNSARNFLQGLRSDPNYLLVAKDPVVVAVIEQVRKERDLARAKLLKFATALVEAAEQHPHDPDSISALAALRSDVQTVFPADDASAKQLLARLNKTTEAFNKGSTSDKQEVSQRTAKLREAADKNWPALQAKFSATESFDPQNVSPLVGRLIKFTSDNQIGYRFHPSPTFAFATTIKGHPVAGTLHTTVAEELKRVEEQIGRPLGSSEADGPWDVVAVVTGRQGKLERRVHVEGDGAAKESSAPVEAPVIEIVALKCGPLAVAADPATVKTVADSSYWSVIPTVFLALLASFAALLQARFTPLVASPALAQVQSNQPAAIAWVGLVCALCGIVLLLTGWIYQGFLTNIAIIAAGSFAGLDVLASTRLIPPHLVDKIRPLGVPLGLACLATAILKLLTCGTLTLV